MKLESIGVLVLSVCVGGCTCVSNKPYETYLTALATGAPDKVDAVTATKTALANAKTCQIDHSGDDPLCLNHFLLMPVPPTVAKMKGAAKGQSKDQGKDQSEGQSKDQSKDQDSTLSDVEYYPRLNRLYEMYQQGLALCLAAKNKRYWWIEAGHNSFSLGDIVVGAAAPIAAATGATAGTTALVSGLSTVFGSQVKSAVDGAAPSSANDFSQTQTALNGLYTVYSLDPSLTTDGTGPDKTMDDQALDTYWRFKIALTQTCYSDLAFSSTKASDAAPDGAKKKTADNETPATKRKAKKKAAGAADAEDSADQ